MLSKDELLAKSSFREPVPITVPTFGDLLLRFPTFKEWHNIVALHRKAEGAISADVVARTLAVVIAEPDGTRMLSDSEAMKLLEKDFDAVSDIYRKAWETVLRVDDKVEEAEKN